MNDFWECFIANRRQTHQWSERGKPWFAGGSVLPAVGETLQPTPSKAKEGQQHAHPRPLEVREEEEKHHSVGQATQCLPGLPHTQKPVTWWSTGEVLRLPIRPWTQLASTQSPLTGCSLKGGAAPKPRKGICAHSYLQGQSSWPPPHERSCLRTLVIAALVTPGAGVGHPPLPRAPGPGARFSREQSPGSVVSASGLLQRAASPAVSGRTDPHLRARGSEGPSPPAPP